MKLRTKRFALEMIKLTESLQRNRACDVMARQLVRCGTSVGANHRASCRARSQADFVAKMGIVEEEADECIYCIELLIDAGFVKANQVETVINEANYGGVHTDSTSQKSIVHTINFQVFRRIGSHD